MDGGTLPPLGVFKLVGDSVGVFFRHFFVFLLIAAIPGLIAIGSGSLVTETVIGDGTFTSSTAYSLGSAGAIALICGFVAVGAGTLAAYDLKLGRRVRYGFYVKRALVTLPLVILLGLIYYVFFLLGLVLLILPGLYFAARYYVFIPAILVERAGFSGLSRAAELSRHYRWPIVGAIILYFIVLILVGLLMGALNAGAAAGLLQPGISTASLLLLRLVEFLQTLMQYGLGATFTALLYARLREIKEGVGVEDLASVFE